MRRRGHGGKKWPEELTPHLRRKLDGLIQKHGGAVGANGLTVRAEKG